MTGFVHVLLTPVSFALRALLVGVLDRTRPASALSEGRRPRGQIGVLLVLLPVSVPLLGRYLTRLHQ